MKARLGLFVSKSKGSTGELLLLSSSERLELSIAISNCNQKRNNEACASEDDSSIYR